MAQQISLTGTDVPQRRKHDKPHNLAGKEVMLKGSNQYWATGSVYRVEDWADRVFGKYVRDLSGHPASIQYMARMAHGNLPNDDEVLYGKIGWLGFVVHVTEIEGLEN